MKKKQLIDIAIVEKEREELKTSNEDPVSRQLGKQNIKMILKNLDK